MFFHDCHQKLSTKYSIFLSKYHRMSSRGKSQIKLLLNSGKFPNFQSFKLVNECNKNCMNHTKNWQNILKDFPEQKVTLRVQSVRYSIVKFAETSKEIIFCRGKNTCRGWSRADLRLVYRFWGHLIWVPKFKKVKKEKLTFCRKIKNFHL